MNEKLSVADYISALNKGGPEDGFMLVYDSYTKQVECHIYKRLVNNWRKDWGNCVDPATHKFDVTQDTFFKFSLFNAKFWENDCQGKLDSIAGLLCTISNGKVHEHLHRRFCADLPCILTDNVDDMIYELLDKTPGGMIDENLMFTQAMESLPAIHREALEDYLSGLSHEEISVKRGITPQASIRRRSEAIQKYRRYYAD